MTTDLSRFDLPLRAVPFVRHERGLTVCEKGAERFLNGNSVEFAYVRITRQYDACLGFQRRPGLPRTLVGDYPNVAAQEPGSCREPCRQQGQYRGGHSCVLCRKPGSSGYSGQKSRRKAQGNVDAGPKLHSAMGDAYLACRFQAQVLDFSAEASRPCR